MEARAARMSQLKVHQEMAEGNALLNRQRQRRGLSTPSPTARRSLVGEFAFDRAVAIVLRRENAAADGVDPPAFAPKPAFCNASAADQYQRFVARFQSRAQLTPMKNVNIAAPDLPISSATCYPVPQIQRRRLIERQKRNSKRCSGAFVEILDLAPD